MAEEKNKEKADSKEKVEEKIEKENKMRKIFIEKVVLSVGATGDELEKGMKLLKLISEKKPIKTRTRKRIPNFAVRPGLEIGCKVTLRGKEVEELLKKLLATIDNQLKEKQVVDENFSFGIKEYIEIPGMEYQRDIGIIGFGVTVVFRRKGKRTEIKKIKRGKNPKKQKVTKKEIIDFMKENYNVEFLTKFNREIR